MQAGYHGKTTWLNAMSICWEAALLKGPMKRLAASITFLAMLAACDSSRPSDSLVVESVASKIALAGGTAEQINFVKNGSVSDVSCSAGEITTCDFEIDSNGITRVSEQGTLVTPWDKVTALHTYETGFILEVGAGGMPVPFRVLSPAQRKELTSLVARHTAGAT